MRICCFILSIYVLVLSAIPCCSEDNCVDETKTAQSNEHAQEEDRGCDGSCSPFLTCGNCVGFTVSNVTLTFKAYKGFIQPIRLLPFYKNKLENTFISKIWQPPK
jgi:hypothetical protein